MSTIPHARLQFLGAVGTVTGSRYLIDHEGRRLLVDCGLFQGLKQLRLRNWAPFPVEPASIDAVILTHAHLDHSGYLPRLMEEGFSGPVHVTPGTADLLPILLRDAGRLQEEDARYANRHHFSKHAAALPLYTEAMAERVLNHVKAHRFGERFDVLPGWQSTFSHAGHIIGAASVHLAGGFGSLLFSGDLGRSDDPMMLPPAPAPDADIVVVESTYGDRRHPVPPGDDELAQILSRTAARGGTTLIPAFAVGRAQAVLHAILKLKRERRIPDLPLYLNSPMAMRVSQLLRPHADEQRLTEQDLQDLAAEVRYVASEQASRELNRPAYPSVIVAASGMATGGRVLHHLKALAPHAQHTLLFAGYQAMGTRGAALVAGAERIRLHGEWIPVRAEVRQLQGMSSHADQEQLLQWLATPTQRPRRVYVTHGEPTASDTLRQAIEERMGGTVSVPEFLDQVELPLD